MDRISFLNQLASQKWRYNLGAGTPPVDLYPFSELTIPDPSVKPEILGYHETAGFIRQAAARTLEYNEGIKIDPDCILITNGVQEAITLALSVFRNSPVFCLDPGYPGFEDCAGLFGLKPSKLAETDWEDAISSIPEGALLYISSDFANPGGKSLNEHQRTYLCDCARQNGFYIFDDATYRPFYLEQAPGTLKAKAPGQVIHAISFSKIVAPGLRTGFIYIPEVLVKRFIQAKSNLSLNNSGITQYLVLKWLEKNNYSLTDHLHLLRERLSDNQKILLNHKVFFQGGFFCTLNLGISADFYFCSELLRKEGISVCPMMLFTQNIAYQNQLRLCVANTEAEDLRFVLDYFSGLR